MTTILVDPYGDTQLTRGHDCVGLTDMYGGAEMRRVTEIHMDSSTRRFFIEWKVRLALDGFEYVPRGQHHNLENHQNIFCPEDMPRPIGRLYTPKPCVSVKIEYDDKVLTFTTYEDAVKYEVSCLDEMRRKGVIFP